MRLIKCILSGVLLLGFQGVFADEGMAAIQQAAQDNKHLFIFFYKDLNERTLRAKEIFDQTAKDLAAQAAFIRINVKDPEEKKIVEMFDLKRTPMPFTLVVAPNGAVTGGFPLTVAKEQLTEALSSPGMAGCLKGLQDKKLVFLCVQNGRTSDNEAALKGVKDFKADARYAGAAEIVTIDPSNPQEQKFLQQLNVNTLTSKALTVFMSPPAETIGQYVGATDKERFVSDLQKAVSGCCGPGGCCPGGCCPGGKCK